MMLRNKIGLFAVVCAILMCFGSYHVTNAENQIIGSVVTTDIIAVIDDEPIPSYNINGNTAVVAENLSDYGFDVEWNPEARTLKINYNKQKRYWPIDQSDSRFRMSEIYGLNEKLFDIYQTDIQVYLDGMQIEAFNIDGLTAIYIDTLEMHGKLIWDEKRRIIELQRPHDNFPFNLDSYNLESAKQMGKKVDKYGYDAFFISPYFLKPANQSAARGEFISKVVMYTPYINLISRYATAAEKGEDTLDLNIDEWMNWQKSGQVLQFLVVAESKSPDLFKNIQFGLLQDSAYIEASYVDIDDDVKGPDSNGIYECSMGVMINTLNAIHYDRPAKFIAKPAGDQSLQEAAFEVVFSMYE